MAWLVWKSFAVFLAFRHSVFCLFASHKHCTKDQCSSVVTMSFEDDPLEYNQCCLGYLYTHCTKDQSFISLRMPAPMFTEKTLSQECSTQNKQAPMRRPDLKVQHRSELVHSIPVHQANETKFILPAKGGKRGNPTVRYNV